MRNGRDDDGAAIRRKESRRSIDDGVAEAFGVERVPADLSRRPREARLPRRHQARRHRSRSERARAIAAARSAQARRARLRAPRRARRACAAAADARTRRARSWPWTRRRRRRSWTTVGGGDRGRVGAAIATTTFRPGDFERFAGEIPEQGPESEQAGVVRAWCERVLELGEAAARDPHRGERDADHRAAVRRRRARCSPSDTASCSTRCRCSANKALVGTQGRERHRARLRGVQRAPRRGARGEGAASSPIAFAATAASNCFRR